MSGGQHTQSVEGWYQNVPGLKIVAPTTPADYRAYLRAKGEEQNVMLSYYNDDDTAPEKMVKVEFKNVLNKNGVRLEYYCLDAERDCELVREEIFTSSDFSSYIKMPLFSTYLLKIVAL